MGASASSGGALEVNPLHAVQFSVSLKEIETLNTSFRNALMTFQCDAVLEMEEWIVHHVLSAVKDFEGSCAEILCRRWEVDNGGSSVICTTQEQLVRTYLNCVEPLASVALQLIEKILCIISQAEEDLASKTAQGGGESDLNARRTTVRNKLSLALHLQRERAMSMIQSKLLEFLSNLQGNETAAVALLRPLQSDFRHDATLDAVVPPAEEALRRGKESKSDVDVTKSDFTAFVVGAATGILDVPFLVDRAAYLQKTTSVLSAKVHQVSEVVNTIRDRLTAERLKHQYLKRSSPSNGSRLLVLEASDDAAKLLEQQNILLQALIFDVHHSTGQGACPMACTLTTRNGSAILEFDCAGGPFRCRLHVEKTLNKPAFTLLGRYCRISNSAVTLIIDKAVENDVLLYKFQVLHLTKMLSSHWRLEELELAFEVVIPVD